jgi:hypothetical protein
MLSRNNAFHLALVAYDRSRIVAAKENGWIGNRNSADTELLDRWKERHDIEKLWKTICDAAARPLLPEELIETVLRARRSAVASSNRAYGVQSGRSKTAKKIAGFMDEWPGYLADLKQDVKKLTQAVNALPSTSKVLEAGNLFEALAQAASTFAWDAVDARDEYRSRFDFSDHLGLHHDAKFVLSQKDQYGSRPLRLFMQIMHNYLHLLCCGRYLDEQVRVLAEIAFDRDVTLDQSVAARRPTTKQARRRS